MPRETKIYVVPTEGRDKGKRFVITEMPALKAERWAFRALLALSRSGVDLSEEVQNSGMQGIARAGLKALHALNFEEARPLLDEMWDCVKIVPDPRYIENARPLVMNETEGDDIEELTTVWELRQQVFNMHTDFFFRGSK